MGSVGANRGSSNSLASLKSSIQSSYRTVTVDVRDRWGDVFQQDTGYTDGKGNLFNVTSQGRNSAGEEIFRVDIGDTTRGFVAANSGLTEDEAWRRLDRYLRGNR